MEILRDAIKCNVCKNILNSPVFLPCGQSVCEQHTKNCANNIYHCVICKSEHAVPQAGFIINQALNQIIITNVHKINFSDDYNEALNQCKVLANAISDLKSLKNDPNFYINDIVGKLKTQTELIREQYKQEINQKADNIIKQLENYEIECRSHSNSNEFKHECAELDKILGLTNDDLTKWQTILNNLETDRKTWKEIKEKSESSASCLKDRLNDLKSELLLKKFSRHHLTVTDFTNLNLISKVDNNSGDFEVLLEVQERNSSIIESKQFETLLQTCEFSIKTPMKLLYRASRDGFSSEAFHSKCDNIPKTLVIIKTTEELVFGGFSKVCWDKSNQYKRDDQAFLFSLVNKNHRPFKMKIMIVDHAIYCSADSGPIFGSGNDIYIASNSNKSNKSYSCLHSYYKNPNMGINFGTPSSLAGNRNFLVNEIEIFQIKSIL